MAIKRVLFVAEAVTLAHVGRMFSLARRLDPSRYQSLLAWHPRYNHLLGEQPFPFFPLESLTPELFMQRLLRGGQVYDFRELESSAVWDLEIFRQARPDVVVGDFRLSLVSSTKIAGIPFLNVINAHWSPHAKTRFAVPETHLTRLFGPAIAGAVFKVARPFLFRAFARDISRLNEKFGRPAFGSDLRSIYCDGDYTLYPDFPQVVPTE